MSDLNQHNKTSSQERLRRIAWEVGHNYPVPLISDYIVLSMVHPRLGLAYWHAKTESAEALKNNRGSALDWAALVVRIYDVTDIIFNGLNAHSFLDLDAGGLAGNCYFKVDRPARNYLAEIGFRGRDGSFHSLARSAPVYFDRDRPSGNFQTSGLFVGGALNRVFSVETIFDAPVYERMNRELSDIERNEALSVAVVFLSLDQPGFNSPLGSFIRNFSRRFKKFGGKAKLFAPPPEEMENISNEFLIDRIRTLSEKMFRHLVAAHKKSPFHIVHCHDWYSSYVGLEASRELGIPVVMSIHSTEYERTHGNTIDRISTLICDIEKAAVQAADLVIVPHSSTRRQVINLYASSEDKAVIIPDVFSDITCCGRPASVEVRQLLGLTLDAPIALFAGEMSHAAGADLLVDALPTVCRNHGTAQFVLAGEGPLKNELEARARHAGISHRCRFPGDLSKETFDALLASADFVVIPARTWQNEGLAQTAIGCGKPVLTTHQAGINCVAHGENGLVTFDNPGSIVWGLQELLFNPLRGSMLRVAARRGAKEAPSLETIAAQHYMYYEIVLKKEKAGNV